MDRNEAIGLTRRFFALHETRADELAPAVYRQPAADYTSADHLERERRSLFRGTPLLAGLSALAVGDLPMARRQLRVLKRRAEAGAVDTR